MEYSREVEIAQIAAIMSDHICDDLYKKQGAGYINTTETIARWAVEFYILHENTNWEEVLDNGIVPQSADSGRIICWDDACVDYAIFKMGQV